MTNETDVLLTETEVKECREVLEHLLEQLDLALFGRTDIHKMVLIGLMCQGHILLEGLPGLGKTVLVKTLSRLLKLETNRVQFTPDLMPGDILGNHILQETETGKREMVFMPGPVFTNLLLADEINRASPKTQAALLEAMQERSVTLMGTTKSISSPFMVLATQNPIELSGTYPLPEAQLDRFLFKLPIADIDHVSISRIISTRRRGETPEPTWSLEESSLELLFTCMEKAYLPQPVADYTARLVAATHTDGAEAPEQVKTYVKHGTSPRAAIGIAEAARGHALLAGSPSVGFEDVKAVAPYVLNHRLILNYKAGFDKVDVWQILDSLLSNLDETGMDLPETVTLR